MDNATEFLTDLATPVKARKIRASKHDFKNGEGKVFAHRHSNGDGWVADTAYVAESVKVSSGCGVYGYARVTDEVVLSGKACVGDHARVMHNAKLSGNTIVRGSAIVRDRVNLTERAFISGQAHLSGNTFAQGKVFITDFAVVHNARCNGPKSSYTIEIRGNARIFDSTLRGPVFILDSAYLDNATVTFAGCINSGKIINATVNTGHVDGEITMFAYPRRRRRGGSAATEPDPTTVPSLAGRLICVQGLVMNSQMMMRPCVITPHAYVLGCTFSLYGQSWPVDFTEFPPGPIHSLNTNRLESVVNWYRRTSAPTAAPSAIPAIASVGIAPSFDQIRQRRIMRMEETT